MTRFAADTSVAIALLLKRHLAHPATTAQVGERDLFLAGHAAYETYSTLTRFPGDGRVAPGDAVELIRDRFLGVITHDAEGFDLLARFAESGVAGGAMYDALVAAAVAKHPDVVLLSRDVRAAGTYSRMGATVEMLTTT